MSKCNPPVQKIAGFRVWSASSKRAQFLFSHIVIFLIVVIIMGENSISRSGWTNLFGPATDSRFHRSLRNQPNYIDRQFPIPGSTSTHPKGGPWWPRWAHGMPQSPNPGTVHRTHTDTIPCLEWSRTPRWSDSSWFLHWKGSGRHTTADRICYHPVPWRTSPVMINESENTNCWLERSYRSWQVVVIPVECQLH